MSFEMKLKLEEDEDLEKKYNKYKKMIKTLYEYSKILKLKQLGTVQ